MTLEEILAQVQMGGLSPEAAGKLIRQDGYKEMDYAKLDTGRKARTGFAEVIYCSNKADAHLLKIFERLYMEEGEVLGTRASQAQYELVKEKFPEVQYDPVSRILKIEKPDKIHEGKVAVCTAGTADIPVAEEAAQTAEYFGTHVERIYDVGVSGMHRLFSRLEIIQDANCVVAVAGMEGALASVMGGLVSRPVSVYLCIQDYIEITGINPGFRHPAYFYLKSLHRNTFKYILQHLLICSQIQQCCHCHITTDSGITLQI